MRKPLEGLFVVEMTSYWSATTTARFLRDWRATISKLFSENFYGTMAALAREKGLTISYETAAGAVFPAHLLAYYK